jgi:hypothetical protein
VKYSFQVGAAVFLLAVLWTVFTTREAPPEDMEAFERERRERRGVGALLGEIGGAIGQMPRTMKQLAVVQFFTWLGLFCMWMFFVPTVARHVFGATDPGSELYARGIEWGGLTFAIYSVVCFAVAFALPKLAAATSRKATHAAALACGAAGLLSLYFIHDRYVLWLTMVGVGIAWASILSMPYAILAGALPPQRMGVYMGVFTSSSSSRDPGGTHLRAHHPRRVRRVQPQLVAVHGDGGRRVPAGRRRHGDAGARRGRPGRAGGRGDRRRRARGLQRAGLGAAGPQHGLVDEEPRR